MDEVSNLAPAAHPYGASLPAPTSPRPAPRRPRGYLLPAAGVNVELVDAPVLDLPEEGERAELLHDVQAAGAIVAGRSEGLRAPVEEVLVVHGLASLTELQAGHGGQGLAAPARGHHHGQLAQARVCAGSRTTPAARATQKRLPPTLTVKLSPSARGSFTLVAEDAGVQRGQGGAVQRGVWRSASGRQLHPRRC